MSLNLVVLYPCPTTPILHPFRGFLSFAAHPFIHRGFREIRCWFAPRLTLFIPVIVCLGSSKILHPHISFNRGHISKNQKLPCGLKPEHSMVCSVSKENLEDIEVTIWSKRLTFTSNVPHSFFNFIFLFMFFFMCLGKLFLLLFVEKWILQSVHMWQVCAEQVLWKLLTLQKGKWWSRQAKGTVLVVSWDLLAIREGGSGRPSAGRSVARTVHHRKEWQELFIL